MYIMRGSQMLHVPAKDVTFSDSLFLVDNPGTLIPVKIKSIQEDVVPIEDLIQVYTPSNNLIANNLYASCKSEKDGSEYFLSPFTMISKYVHSDLPQMISDIYHYINLRAPIKYLLNRVL